MPSAALASSSSAPPRSVRTARTRRRSGPSGRSTSSHRNWPVRSASTLAVSSATAGQPPVRPRTAGSMPCRSANPASSSSENRRSSSPTRSSSPVAASRATRMGSGPRLATTRWPLSGRASTRSESHPAPSDPSGTRWALSRTRHTCSGARRHTASATARGSTGSPAAAKALGPPNPERPGAPPPRVGPPAPAPPPRAGPPAPGPPPGSVLPMPLAPPRPMGSMWSTGAAGAAPGSTAARASRARLSAWASPACRPSHTSAPRGARRFSAIDCASSVVLPRPAPPVTTVTRFSQRASIVRRSRGRVSEAVRGSGG